MREGTNIMKKVFAFFLSAVMTAALFCFPVTAEDTADAESTGTKTEDVNIRDPFVLLHNDTYYMYGTGCASRGYGCWKSDDLEHWQGPFTVYTFAGDSDFDGCAWAPECHCYKDSFYLFATYKSKESGKRGVSIFRAQDPMGPFEEITDGHITPHNHDAIDGTLYVDAAGEPWMVYVGEWTSNADEVGDMMCVRLSEDLTHFISEPKLLFRATDAKWAKGKITDGPFLYNTSDGGLLMLWSNSARSGGYSVGIAFSKNGEVDGRWVHPLWALYKRNKRNIYDGGHGMIFKDRDGRLLMAIHSPNSASDGVREHPVFVPVEDIGHTVVCVPQNTNTVSRFFVSAYNRIKNFCVKVHCAAVR